MFYVALKALGKSKTEQRIMQSLRRADVDATSVQGQQTANLIAQIESEKEALKGAKEASDFIRDSVKDAFSDLIPGIETGNKALDSLINKLMQASAEAMFFGYGPLGSFFGGAGGSSPASSVVIARLVAGSIRGAIISWAKTVQN